MKTYALLMLFSTISFVAFRRKFSLIATSAMSALAASSLLQVFARMVEGYHDPLWLVGLLVGSLLCLVWCGLLALIDWRLRKRRTN